MELVELGKVCEILSGATPSRRKPEYFGGNINWFTPKDLSNLSSKYVKSSPEKITQEGYDSCSAHILPTYSVLFSSRAPIGHIAINLEECCTNQGFKSLVPQKDKLDYLYLFYILQRNTTRIKNLGRGATFKELSKSDFLKFKIPLPSLAEQKRIAGILDTADKLRQLNKQLITKYEQLSQSLFLDMFGDPVTNPKGWEVKVLNEVITDIQNGIGKGKKYYGRGNKVANIGDLYPNYNFVPTKFSLLEVNEKEIEKYKLKYGDLLFVRSSLKKEGVAFCSFFNSNEICLFSSFMIKITPDLELLNPYFLSIQMRTKSYRKYIINASNTATITNISQPNLKALKIIVPGKQLQTQFADRIQLIEQQKQQAQEALQKSEDLFNALLQKAFKGGL